ncbi:MAG: CBS domain-containing protein [Aquisalimonadaceae bacterium]
MKAKEIMHTGADWMEPDTSIVDIARLMRDQNIGAVPISENDTLAGMVTDRDIVIRAIAEEKDPQSTTAKDIMSSEALWSYEDADVDEVAKLMKQKRVRRVAIINQDKRLVGMVSVGDITKASGELAGDTLRDLSAVGD